MHIHSTSINVYCCKFKIQTQSKKIYENDKFQMHMHEKTNYQEFCPCGAYASNICYFHMIFYKKNLNLKFCYNVHL